jgi:protoporphyrin/coproporphyrin ferrochelatase
MSFFTLSPFAPEPQPDAAALRSGSATQKTAVLFCNLGTPDAPTATAVRRFLGEFLSDQRVVEIPKPLWWLILNGIILRVRPAKSAAKYASIWRPEGSPLKYWTEKQALLLQGFLAQRGLMAQVRYAMRYGATSIPSQIDLLKQQGVERILVLPAYPQYSTTTTASLFDAVYSWGAQARRIPEFRFVNSYHNDAGYIKALESSVRKYWLAHGKPDQLVMSFHGVPERTVALGDPYADQCRETARLLAQSLDLQGDQWKLTFQSRLGRAKWLQPYTEPSLIAMGKAGVRRVDVVCPGFNCDGLETLEEINMEAREAFLHAGGKEFHHIPGLNDSDAWISALCGIAQRHLTGWD